MVRRWLLLPSLWAAALVGPLSFAAGNGTSSSAKATFRVALTGTTTMSWRYRRESNAGDCTRTRTGTATRTLRVRSLRPSTVTVLGAPGRVRYAGTTVRHLAGTVRQRGSGRVASSGPPPCETSVEVLDCAGVERSFRNASVRFVSPRRGALSLRRIRGGVGDRQVRSNCPGEPRAVKVRTPGIELAPGRISEQALFDPTAAVSFASGSYEETTTFTGPEEGRVVERVGWTLTFTRVYR